MVLVVLGVLIALFVVLPLAGVAIGYLVMAVITGLVFGALGRLVIPGKQPIGALLTIGAGLIGSLGGTLIAHAIGVHRFATLLIEIAVSAGVVMLVAGRERQQVTR